MQTREYALDRLRTVMTACVVFHHCAITYGGSGGWFYYERHFAPNLPSLLLTFFTATQQAYFMGFFFLLAGYFTPASLDRKGYGSFLADRFLRLGLPLLAFGLLVGPLTAGLADAFTGGSFPGTLAYLWHTRHFINGPLWFAQALLIFSLGYCLWRVLMGRVEIRLRPLPTHRVWLLSALAVGAAAFLIRLAIPVGRNIFGLQLGFFAGYIFLFALGIAAQRHNWLQQLSWKQVRPWAILSLCTWPMMPLSIFLVVHVLPRGQGSFEGGFSWPALVYAFWEPFFAFGVIATLLVAFRRWLNQPSALWSWLDRRAYAVYFLHPPILVGVALAFHPWGAPPLLKFAVTGLVSCMVCWIAAEPLVRLPGLRRIF